MSIIALMVTKNEADRYLEPALDWLDQQVDEIFVYDDESTDKTRDIANSYGLVCRRGQGRPPFLEHEGRFRTDALRSLETVMAPRDDDWIFVADADEFFVPNNDRLDDLIAGCQPHHEAVRIRIHTVWEQVDGELHHRIDGPWSTLYEPRLWKWRAGLAFADAPMACRNEPVFITMNFGLQAMPQDVGSAILHYGYASQRDRAHRYKRYTSEVPTHGHAPELIESIHDPQVVWTSWPGEVPADVR